MIRQPPPGASSIAEYWAGRTLPETQDNSIVEHFAEEPTCMACGWWNPRPDNPYAGLQQAHAVPHALDGSNDPSNYALLCAPCHAEAPDVGDSFWFWRWVSERPRRSAFDRHFAATHAVFDILTAQEVEALSHYSQDELWQLLDRARITAGDAVSHSGRVSSGTYAALMKIASGIARGELPVEDLPSHHRSTGPEQPSRSGS